MFTASLPFNFDTLWWKNDFLFSRTFRVWDDNNDRSLNFEEFDKGVTESGAKLSAEEAKELFSSFDKDGAGSIDFDELLIAIRVIILYPKK